MTSPYIDQLQYLVQQNRAAMRRNRKQRPGRQQKSVPGGIIARPVMVTRVA